MLSIKLNNVMDLNKVMCSSVAFIIIIIILVKHLYRGFSFYDTSRVCLFDGYFVLDTAPFGFVYHPKAFTPRQCSSGTNMVLDGIDLK